MGDVVSVGSSSEGRGGRVQWVVVSERSGVAAGVVVYQLPQRYVKLIRARGAVVFLSTAPAATCFRTSGVAHRALLRAMMVLQRASVGVCVGVGACGFAYSRVRAYTQPFGRTYRMPTLGGAGMP